MDLCILCMVVFCDVLLVISCVSLLVLILMLVYRLFWFRVLGRFSSIVLCMCVVFSSIGLCSLVVLFIICRECEVQFLVFLVLVWILNSVFSSSILNRFGMVMISKFLVSNFMCICLCYDYFYGVKLLVQCCCDLLFGECQVVLDGIGFDLQCVFFGVFLLFCFVYVLVCLWIMGYVDLVLQVCVFGN